MFDEPTAGPRARQKEATRRAVLEAAREEFEAAGFEGANLRAIAKRAGVSAGTVLHYARDKRDLLHAALFEDLDATLQRALARPGPGPLEAQCDRLARAVLRSYARRPALSRALLKESLFAEPPWSERFVAQTAGVHAALARLVEAAAGRGELRRDVDPALFAVAWLSFFYFGLLSWVQGAHPKPAALVDRLVRQHLEGLRPGPRRSTR